MLHETRHEATMTTESDKLSRIESRLLLKVQEMCEDLIIFSKSFEKFPFLSYQLFDNIVDDSLYWFWKRVSMASFKATHFFFR